jgi:hypothetical protein
MRGSCASPWRRPRFLRARWRPALTCNRGSLAELRPSPPNRRCLASFTSHHPFAWWSMATRGVVLGAEVGEQPRPGRSCMEVRPSRVWYRPDLVPCLSQRFGLLQLRTAKGMARQGGKLVQRRVDPVGRRDIAAAHGRLALEWNPYNEIARRGCLLAWARPHDA